MFYWGCTHKPFKSDPLVIVAFCWSDFYLLVFFLTSRPLSPSCRRSKTFCILYSHHQSYVAAHLSAEHIGEERLYSLLERTWSKTRLWNKWQQRPSETPRADSKKKKKMHWGGKMEGNSQIWTLKQPRSESTCVHVCSFWNLSALFISVCLWIPLHLPFCASPPSWKLMN